MSILEDIDRFSIDFKKIVITIKNIETKHKQIVENLAYLKIQYSDMVKNNTKKIFIFCLDSFFYQYKMYSAELDQIESSRKMVNNRMYCEYYKLFGIISNYLNDSNVTYENKRTLLKTCPIYKDLEPMFEFDMVDIENIYSNVILLITHLYEQTIKNSVEIEDFSETRNGDLRCSGKGSEPVKLRTSEKFGQGLKSPTTNLVDDHRSSEKFGQSNAVAQQLTAEGISHPALFGQSHYVAQQLTQMVTKSPNEFGQGPPVPTTKLEGSRRLPENFGPISNFVNTLRNDNLILKGQLDLFLNYLSFFLASQQKQYSRIEERITHFLNELQDKPVATLIVNEEEPIVNKEEPVVNKEEPIINEEEPIINEKKDSPRLDMAYE